ncbi:TonB-dependent receptor [Terasakiella pusilla]|uniref:TonB-dependent receptor n=1 Tax=Terasakiella pusilla TaxID=64973 RepID=UPI003AA81B0E
MKSRYNYKERRKLTWMATTVLAGMFIPAVAAQENVTAPENNDDATFNMEEIVITATKREAKLQDVPLSVRALQGDDLIRIGAVDLDSYARTVPGISLDESGPGQNRVNIRGLASVSGRASTVGYYIDGIAQSQNEQSDLELYDVRSVEILRGPQGTLYGEGSIGGSILVSTNKPSMEGFEVSGDLELSSISKGGEGYAARGMVNVPLVDDILAMRFVGYYRDDSGFIDNITTGKKDVNDMERKGGRVQFLYQPNEEFDVTLGAYYQKMTTGSLQTQNPRIGVRYQTRAPIDESNIQNIFQVSANANYDFGAATLTSVTGYYERDQELNQIFSQFIAFGGSDDEFAGRKNDEPTSIFNHEMRLVSNGDEKFDWLFGVYYNRRNQSFNQDIFFVTDGALDADPFISFLEEFKIRQYAVFGEGSYELTENLDLTLGLRYYREVYSYNGSESFFGGAPTLKTPPNGNDTNWSPKFALTYKATADLNLYANVTKGYRAGGHTANNPVDTPPGLTEKEFTFFQPDVSWNYEAGFKGSFADGKLIVNAAAYYIEWQNMQVFDQFLNTDVGDFVSYISNAGSAESKGFELEVFARPIDGLSVNAGIAYTDATLTEDAPVIDGYKGDSLGDIPDWTVSLDAQYEFNLTNDLDAYVGGSYQYIGEAADNFTAVVFDDDRSIDSYNIAGLRVGIRSDNWEFRLFADNLFNEYNVLSYLVIQEVLLPPRKVGAKFSFHF